MNNNPSIAKMIGWELRDGVGPLGHEDQFQYWHAPEGPIVFQGEANFNGSMYACEKWILPFLKEEHGIDTIEFQLEDTGDVSCYMENSWKRKETYKGNGPSLSSALCAAVLTMGENDG